MDNPLLKEELYVSLLIPDVLCQVVHEDGRRENNFYTRCYDRDNSQTKTKSYMDIVSDALHRICGHHSSTSVRHPSSKDVDFWLTF